MVTQKKRGTDDSCSFFGQRDNNGNIYCNKAFESDCPHKIDVVIHGCPSTMCGLYGNVDLTNYEDEDDYEDEYDD